MRLAGKEYELHIGSYALRMPAGGSMDVHMELDMHGIQDSEKCAI